MFPSSQFLLLLFFCFVWKEMMIVWLRETTHCITFFLPSCRGSPSIFFRPRKKQLRLTQIEHSLFHIRSSLSSSLSLSHSSLHFFNPYSDHQAVFSLCCLPHLVISAIVLFVCLFFFFYSKKWWKITAQTTSLALSSWESSWCLPAPHWKPSQELVANCARDAAPVAGHAKVLRWIRIGWTLLLCRKLAL